MAHVKVDSPASTAEVEMEEQAPPSAGVRSQDLNEHTHTPEWTSRAIMVRVCGTSLPVLQLLCVCVSTEVLRAYVTAACRSRGSL